MRFVDTQMQSRQNLPQAVLHIALFSYQPLCSDYRYSTTPTWSRPHGCSRSMSVSWLLSTSWNWLRCSCCCQRDDDGVKFFPSKRPCHPHRQFRPFTVHHDRGTFKVCPCIHGNDDGLSLEIGFLRLGCEGFKFHRVCSASCCCSAQPATTHFAWSGCGEGLHRRAGGGGNLGSCCMLLVKRRVGNIDCRSSKDFA